MTAITAGHMSRAVIRLPSAFFFPTLALALAWLATTYSDRIPEGVTQILPYLVYALAAGGAVLGWRFDRSRLVFSLAAVTIGHWLLLGPAGINDKSLPGQTGYLIYATLFPAFLTVLAMLRERGLVSRPGIVRMLAFALLAGIGAAFATGHLWLAPEFAENVQGALVATLSRDILPDAWTAWTVLPDPALLVFAMAAAFLFFRMIVLRDPPLETGALGALIAVGAAINFAGDATATTVFPAAAALILVAVAVQDSYRLAFLDELTGLPGRRALKMESMKLGQRYAIAMLDIDHFKKFNDTYGHDVGDQVLRMVAARMARVSGGGKPFRFGGEEFTILFPGKTSEEAFDHLDSLRETIAGSGFIIRDRKRPRRKPNQPVAQKMPKKKPKSVKVTISIGVAERGNGNSDPDAVIKAADEALYKAKKEGRNRVAA